MTPTDVGAARVAPKVDLCLEPLPLLRSLSARQFQPFQTQEAADIAHLPAPLTSFIARAAEVDDVRRLIAVSRLVTLSGAGGAGKTRLAMDVACKMATGFADGACHVDLGSISHPHLVAATVAGALGLADQRGRAGMETVLRFVGDRQMLLLLDNCEHLLDGNAALVSALMRACPNMKVLATSREPIGVAGEVTWRVPSLSLIDEAVELFTERARLVRPAFSLTDTNRATVTEICRRLDGMPLAIELAAARVRVLSPTEVLDGLDDRFLLLTGGARAAAPRQQTLRASVDWSHALLSPPDHILDLLTMLIDKSLVVADDHQTYTRYRLLETVRQYGFEKLGESGEAEKVRNRHRDFYTLLAVLVDTPAQSGHKPGLMRALREMDNLRAAFAWSRESSSTEVALILASSLQQLWLAFGRASEGLAWFDAVLTDGEHHSDVASTVRARAFADRAVLHSWAMGTERADQAELALAIARECGDRGLLARALTARGIVAAHHGEPVQQYFGEVAELARAVGDRWRLSQILGWQANVGFLAGDPIATRAAAEEGGGVADAIGDRFVARQCRTWAAWAQTVTGDFAGATTQFGAAMDGTKADHDLIWWVLSVHCEAQAAVYQGDLAGAQAGLAEAMPAVAELGALWRGNSNGVAAVAALAAGDVAGADAASRAAWEELTPVPTHQHMHAFLLAEVALARGDLLAAGHWADESVSVVAGWHRVLSLTTRARVEMAGHEPDLADRDAHEALALAASLAANLGIPDVLECLAAIAGARGSHPRCARLFGAAESIRRRMGTVRFKVHDADHELSLQSARNVMGNNDFDEAFAEGCALSTRDAIAYAQRGKGQRKRPRTGWASLTPAERDVLRLVSDGLANKDIAKRLLVSPRTVQTHPTHVYTKLGLTSRVQLVQEASRRNDWSGAR
ncbi:LuxR C-terminal-related transcriptional regulator [Mycobacterium sp. AZCC_0083]|uniref:LuxR C-terminal-related transcriptional regulator n=1 Tax=Mycobacterium sp. AZCC_0083 TaxID=2735882 RepID=UPI001622B472|nr:LuxR C-terminal-related transcriptional regulator [Mycobacterium sp. AZCC_0083]MBB5160421.1 putative ATPase/DNA-binding CsgD family transcriptional regulator [Mycobacterium sp. AZCC_0083]